MADLVTQHIAGLCATYLGPAACADTRLVRDVELQSRQRMPLLEVWRTEERTPERKGTSAAWTRVAVVELTYTLPPTRREKRVDAVGDLVAAAGTILLALQRRQHAGYQGGKTLAELVGVSDITVDSITYQMAPPEGPEAEMPQVALRATVRYEETWTDEPVALTSVTGDLNLDGDAGKPIRRDQVVW